MGLGVVMRVGWCKELSIRTLSSGSYFPKLSHHVELRNRPPPPLRTSVCFPRDHVHWPGSLQIRLLSVGVSLRNSATILSNEDVEGMAAAVDDPLLRTAAVPENSQPQQNLLEELTNSSEDAAIEVVEAAIGEVLQPEEVAADVAPILVTEAVETTAATPDGISVESVDSDAVVEGVTSSPSILETSSAAAEAITEPVNILSSAAVDPNLIPLPPLPPINLPTSTVDLPFSELGLNSWWPTGWVQWVLEFGHTSVGLPWWASILITGVALRVVTIPLFIYSQKIVAENSKIMPKFIELQQKYQEANLGGHWQQKMRAQNDP